MKNDINTLYYGDQKERYNRDNYRTYEASISQTAHYSKARHDRTGAVRKHSGAPYFVHPQGVAKMVQAYRGTKAQIQAAYLHDTMEDTGETADHIAEQFGDDVASIVAELTNDPWEVRRVGKKITSVRNWFHFHTKLYLLNFVICITTKWIIQSLSR